MKRLALPVVLVVGMRLGCLNHALLTMQAISASGSTCAGWIANSIDPAMLRLEENIQTLVERLPCPLLGRVPFLQEPTAANVTPYLDLARLP